ncbi:hypothetical protein [Kordiimonas sp.]|uniref:hypothetical protein n=1 Tax=Kordiimonas sp. TaxID=1970157 RepID=UPI003A8D93E5
MDAATFSAQINPSRPLLLLDADEVLLRFVEHLEAYLPSRGHELRLTSFQLGGNIFDLSTEKRAEGAVVKALIAGFFDDCTHDVPLVDGAREALDSLKAHYDIAVLSNVPDRCRDARATNLRGHGLDVPVIANRGEKGPVAAMLASATRKTVVFVDDLPPQHASVAEHAPDVHRVHFIADPRLGPMLEKAEHAHVRIDDWPTLERHLITLLEG